MAVTISKTKPKQAEKNALPPVEVEAPINLADLTIEALVDRYGALKDKANAIKMNPVFTQLEEAESQLKERLKEYGPLDELKVTGDHWLLEVGVCAKNPRKLKAGAIPLLRKILGDDTFAKLAKVNISDVDKYCTPDQVEQVVETETGYSDKRKLEVKHLG